MIRSRLVVKSSTSATRAPRSGPANRTWRPWWAVIAPAACVFGFASFACGGSKIADRTSPGIGGSAGVDPMNGSGGSVSLDGGIVVGTGGSANATFCNTSVECQGTEICLSSKCTPVLGPCVDDTNCGGDSYCCGSDCRDDGESQGVCIPYGFGPRGTLNPACKGAGERGIFSPALQCEWSGPTANDPDPDSRKVLSTPLVADLPNDSAAAAEIVVVTYNGNDGSGYERATFFGSIRIINGQTCELLETVRDAEQPIRAAATPALADLDGDGTIEIVTRGNEQGLVAFKWNGSRFARMWAAPGDDITQRGSDQAWDGPSIHDLDNDGRPEVLLRGAVYDGRTGRLIFNGTLNTGGVINIPYNGLIPVAADLDADGKIEMVAQVSQEITFLEWRDNQWVDDGIFQGSRMGITGSHFAVADFGTPGATPETFDHTRLDGIAEIVAVSDMEGVVTLHTLNRQRVMQVNTNDRGGPPTIGDFDDDGRPEIAIAGKTRFRVFDLDCRSGASGCESPFVRWSQPSQDASSAQTSSSVFDFDGDGQAEAVYADECFLRVYDGKTGTVSFSAFRTSGTWYENAVVADVDKDDNTEIVVTGNDGVACPELDPIHPGVRCDGDAACPPGSTCGSGFCRCSVNADCGAGLACASPLLGTPGDGRVCRAAHPNTPHPGVRVLRDRLDRWASSRPMWNQHAYSITNINDDGSIPQTSDWVRNWTVSGFNNYRQNEQGGAGFDDLPDITGALSEDTVCSTIAGALVLTATVCNRGARAVGAAMPATFYQGEPSAGKVLCVSYTNGPVPVQGCLDVSCNVDAASITGLVTMVVNDDGAGGLTTLECNSNNNADTISITRCDVR